MAKAAAPRASTLPPHSAEIAAILSACRATNAPVASSPCLRCAHSTVLQLSDGPTPEETPAGLEASPPSLVVYCSRMHRDITVPVGQCSGFSPDP